MSEATPMTPGPTPSPPDPDRPAVLYVDDEPQALKYFARGLGRDFRVLTAEDATAAVATLEREAGRVGVVISDQRMPGRTGVSLLTEVRQRWPNVTRVLITAYTDMESAVAAVNAGAVYKYVHKPADFPTLRQTLDEALAVHRVAAHRDEMARALAALEEQRRATLAAEADREVLNRQLVAASREAGRAEVATGILHNVGNVLNSMQVQAGVVQSTLADSRLPNLPKALAMFDERAADLAAFLTDDEKGRRLPAYLVKLAGVLADEQRAMSDAMASLAKNVEHVAQIVRNQQAHARQVVIRDRVRPADLVAEAVRVARPAIDRYGVAVSERVDGPTTPVLLDQHRVLQILVNLVANAVNAVGEGGPGDGSGADRRVSIRVEDGVGPDGGRRLAFEVADNGVGIAAENLTRMFTFGFTTRTDGHGFGLHSAANAAREMGGCLTAASGGPGRGATFRLELPVDADGGGAAMPAGQSPTPKAMAA